MSVLRSYLEYMRILGCGFVESDGQKCAVAENIATKAYRVFACEGPEKMEEAGMSVARMKRIGRFVRLATIYGISFSHHAQMRSGVRVLEAGKHSRDLTRHLSSPLKIVDLVFFCSFKRVSA